MSAWQLCFPFLHHRNHSSIAGSSHLVIVVVVAFGDGDIEVLVESDSIAGSSHLVIVVVASFGGGNIEVLVESDVVKVCLLVQTRLE